MESDSPFYVQKGLHRDNPIDTLPHKFLTIHFNVSLRSLRLQRDLFHFELSHRHFVCFSSVPCALHVLSTVTSFKHNSHFVADHRGRIIYEMECLLALEHWDYVIESHSGQRCMCFSACATMYKYGFCEELNPLRNV